MSERDGALADFKVVDLTRVLAGPSCVQVLGDHGADIVKVEPPTGDETRTWGPPFNDGEAAYFLGVNRNKRSIGLDLARADSHDVLFRLLDDADLVIENFKTGTLEKWGLGYDEVLKERYPRLIHCRITGFGGDGPMGGIPGYDAVAQALSGMMSINGTQEGGATRVGMPMADLGAGLIALYAIMMAAYEREKSGKGQSIEVALYDAAFSLLHPFNSNFFVSGDRPRRVGNQHPNICPYDTYETTTCDVFLAVGNDRQFRRMCDSMGKPELADDPRYGLNSERSVNRVALTAELDALFAGTDGQEVSARLSAVGVPCGAVLEIPEVCAHPHTAHREMVIEEGDYRGVGIPAKFSRTPGRMHRPPPHFAQHSREILTGLGYTEAEIEELIAVGILIEPEQAAE